MKKKKREEDHHNTTTYNARVTTSFMVKSWPLGDCNVSIITNSRLSRRFAFNAKFCASIVFLVYQSEKIGSNPFYQIYLIDLFTGETNLVSSKVGKATCAWIHPDNKRILFASTYLDPLSKQKQKLQTCS